MMPDCGDNTTRHDEEIAGIELRSRLSRRTTNNGWLKVFSLKLKSDEKCLNFLRISKRNDITKICAASSLEDADHLHCILALAM